MPQLTRSRSLPCLLVALLFSSAASAQLTDTGSFFLDASPDLQDFAIFGEASVSGDFNGDGFDDLAVGASRTDIDEAIEAGKVVIFFGGPDGLSSPGSLVLTQDDHPDGTDCSVPETGDYFGVALAVGDFNDDQLADLAIGAPGEELEQTFTVQAGAVSIFYGQMDSTFTAGACFVAGEGGLPGAANTFAEFGHALAVGDFGTAGFDDLAIGAPGANVGEASGAGTVTVIYSSQGSPLDPASAQLWHQDVEGVEDTAEDDDAFGYALATGDLITGMPEACDLAIGAPGESDPKIEQGVVHVLFGCLPSGLSAQDNVKYNGSDFPDAVSGSPDDRMGSSLAIGNFDCQSADDLAIGVPGRQNLFSLEGEVWIISGNQMMTPSFSVIEQEDLNLEARIFDSFGARLAALDLGGACTDLLIGESSVFAGNNSTRASVHVLEGRPGLGVVTGTVPSYSQPGGGNLGWSMTVGRFDGNRRQVTLGGPGLDRGGVTRAGAVWVLDVANLFLDGFESGNTSAWSVVVD